VQANGTSALFEVEDAVTQRGPAYRQTLEGARVLVIGLARSGVAAARLCLGAHAAVLATDAKPVEALDREAQALVREGVRVIREREASGALAATDLAIVSPGVPLDTPLVRAARAHGVPVISELELAWRAMESDTIAITGTNGKTTTTALTGALLASQPRPVVVAGNIGTPLAAHALTFPVDGIVVAEVSSFQLEATELFQPRVAAVLNVTPDHLDRHGSLEGYTAAKARIFANQTDRDCAVINADDPGATALAPRSGPDVLWFSRTRRLDHGVFVHDGRITAKLNGHYEDVAPLSDIALRGQHNVENVLAATACALWTGMSPEAIRRGIQRFRAVEHRIELVRELGGLQYYNDSKATNVASTLKALDSFGEPVILIAGGKGKGQDFAPLGPAARGRVAHAVVIGEDGPAIAAALERAGVPVTRAGSMEEAITSARRVAVPGSVVLLSPACASFDMFDNYEHRGEVFKRLVGRLD
jgi:UDP-N-acetylmuramoylalanine--D-glutamate ligase